MRTLATALALTALIAACGNGGPAHDQACNTLRNQITAAAADPNTTGTPTGLTPAESAQLTNARTNWQNAARRYTDNERNAALYELPGNPNGQAELDTQWQRFRDGFTATILARNHC